MRTGLDETLHIHETGFPKETATVAPCASRLPHGMLIVAWVRDTNRHAETQLSGNKKEKKKDGQRRFGAKMADGDIPYSRDGRTGEPAHHKTTASTTTSVQLLSLTGETVAVAPL